MFESDSMIIPGSGPTGNPYMISDEDRMASALETALRRFYAQPLGGINLPDFDSHMPDYGESMRVLSQKGEGTDMAKQRARVCVGYNDDGSPVIQQIRGENELELSDNIVRAIMNSARRAEFIDVMVTSGSTVEFLAQKAPTLRDYTEEWQHTYKDRKQRENTKDGYASYLRHHIYPTWGDTPIDQISTRDIQEFLNKRSHLAAKTLREMLNLLKQIFDSAIEDKLITSNPARSSRLSNPGKASVSRKALDQETLAEIAGKLHLLNENDRRFLALALYTGMRKGEIIGLKWEDVDVAENLIYVRRSANVNKGKAIVGEPKTASGKRDIPIAPDLLHNLMPLKANGYIIVGQRNRSGQTPISGTTYNLMIDRIEKTIDMHGATAHVFCHSLGTLLYDASQNVKTVQDIMGHSDFKTTTDRYVHPVEARKQSAMQKVNSLIAPLE